MGPRNAWASGFCGSTLAHWNGESWREVRLPPRFSNGWAWITATIVQGPRADPVGGVLLHWTGRTWNKAKIPFQTLALGVLAHDGHGGLWIASVSTAAPEHVSMLHHTHAGAWTSAVANVDCLDLDSMRQIPRTDSLWAGGSVLADTDTFPVILKYGP